MKRYYGIQELYTYMLLNIHIYLEGHNNKNIILFSK